MNGASCVSCHYWVSANKEKKSLHGVCKRHPPQLDITWTHESERERIEPGYSYSDHRHWNQPVTLASNWCGEWARKTRIES